MASGSKLKTFEGDELDIVWDGGICIHVGECTRARGDLFEAGRKPWCDPAAATPDEAVRVVTRCPSGALHFVRKDGGAGEGADDRNEVSVASGGPLYLRGDLRIEGAPEEKRGLRFRAALCRCGKSGNKPYCDGSHEKADFHDAGAVGESGDGFESEGGPLEVRASSDGPLLLSGRFTIRSGAGRAAWRGAKAALCRCGESGNKPFCDGSHKQAGFRAG